MYILICGSRSFSTTQAVVGAWVNANVSPSDTVIHGEAVGPDRAAGEFARREGATVVGDPIIEEDKEVHGLKRAGLIRNERMYDTWEPDVVVAFWNRTSGGTKHMLDYAIKQGCPNVCIVGEDGKETWVKGSMGARSNVG